MVMPGMSTQLNLQADKPGIFYGTSANMSGEGFAGMHFVVRSLSPQEFESWMSIARITPSSVPLTHAAYALLAAPSSNEAVRYWAPVADDLYTTIANKSMMMSQ
jgi:heme/copper-type cytochrome/quinol oxidase subunit 2